MSEKFKVVVGVQVREGKVGEVGNALAKQKEVIAAYEVTGDSDIIFIGVFDNTLAFERFIRQVLQWKYVKKTTTYVVLSTIKEKLAEE